MKRKAFLLKALIWGYCLVFAQNATADSPPIAIAVHGGAGTIERAKITPEQEALYKTTLRNALEAGHTLLKEGKPGLDAVVEAITILEDSPLFNAGKGAVFTHDGRNELDAAIMDGRTLAAGAVASVRNVANPIILARKVMESSPHVLLVGDGATEFALEQGMSLVPQRYFFTPHRWEQLERKRRQNEASVGPSDNQFGTVGAVVLDSAGNLAAGTSTGGLTGKRFGRVGDSPIIGAGTYANNETVAVSGTGHGEYFIRSVVGHDISALMEYSDMSLDSAVRLVVMEKLVALGGEGGVIAVDKAGNVAMEFNTEGMYRGAIDRDGKMVVEIF